MPELLSINVEKKLNLADLKIHMALFNTIQLKWWENYTLSLLNRTIIENNQEDNGQSIIFFFYNNKLVKTMVHYRLIENQASKLT